MDSFVKISCFDFHPAGHAAQENVDNSRARSEISRPMLSLSDFVAAGRFAAGWIIWEGPGIAGNSGCWFWFAEKRETDKEGAVSVATYQAKVALKEKN